MAKKDENQEEQDFVSPFKKPREMSSGERICNKSTEKGPLETKQVCLIAHGQLHTVQPMTRAISVNVFDFYGCQALS